MWWFWMSSYYVCMSKTIILYCIAYTIVFMNCKKKMLIFSWKLVDNVVSNEMHFMLFCIQWNDKKQSQFSHHFHFNEFNQIRGFQLCVCFFCRVSLPFLLTLSLRRRNRRFKSFFCACVCDIAFKCECCYCENSIYRIQNSMEITFFSISMR